MINVLLIGCGNIGAFYDFENDEVLTYAKAFSLHSDWKITVFDTDRERLSKVAQRYGFETLSTLNELDFRRFHVVCIATSTPTHFAFLNEALKQQVRVIVCEKPVSAQINELEELAIAYQNGSSKVMVNYLRRFQPAYHELKKQVGELLETEAVQSIRFNYKRGLLNNASHGLDLLQFLLESDFRFTNAVISEKTFDAFNDDPTVTCSIPQNGYSLELTGHAFTTEPVFDIAVTFKTKRLLLLEAGNTIRIEENNEEKALVFSINNAIRNYMVPVIDYLEQLINEPQLPDNFRESLELNRHLLLLLNENHT